MKPVEQEFTVGREGLSSEFDDRIAHNLELSGSDIGVQMQNFKPFDCKSLEKWGVFYQEKDSLCAKNFVAMMERVLLRLNYPAKPMAMFPIQGNNIELWQDEIRTKLSKSNRGGS